MNEEERSHHHFLEYLAYVAVGITAILLMIVFYWRSAGPELIINNNPLPVTPVAITDQPYITLIYDYCKKSSAKGMVHVTMVSDRTKLQLPDIIDESHAQCHKDYRFPYPVPPQAGTDTYHFHFEAEYQVNPIKKATTVWDSQEFKITSSLPQVKAQPIPEQPAR